MIALFYLLFFLESTVSYDFAADLKRVKKRCKDDPCTFNEPFVTSETILKFPKECTDFCGVLNINEHTDLSSEQLESFLEGVSIMNGGFRVENTSLSNLKFLKAIFQVYFDRKIGFSIYNNSALTNINSIYYKLIDCDADTDCRMRVESNPMLDASALCENEMFYEFTKMEVYNNLRDCGCPGDSIVPRTLPNFSNCSALTAGLILNDQFENFEDLKALGSVENISGNFEVFGTNLKDLSMFAKLKRIKGAANVVSRLVLFNVHDNPEMSKLGMASLKFLENTSNGRYFVNLENLHPDFCLTINEMTVFLKQRVKFKTVRAKYCEDYVEVEEKTCRFESMESLDSGCVRLFGNLRISSDDEQFVEKLSNVTMLFGTLTIQNTRLEDVNFLKNLKYIGVLNEGVNEPTIRIESNADIQNLHFPSIRYVLSNHKNLAIIQNNAPKALKNTAACRSFQYKLYISVVYNGLNCMNISEVNDKAMAHRADSVWDEDIQSSSHLLSVSMIWLIVLYKIFEK